MRILILGTDGMLGAEARRRLSASRPATVEVVGTTRHPDTASSSPSELRLLRDVRAFDAVEAVLDDARPDTILNCIAVLHGRGEDGDAMRDVNAEFPRRLARAASDRGARVIHISTDGVFSGRHGPYDEHAEPHPVDEYGESKLAGELHDAPHLTVRTSIIGRNASGAGLLDWASAQSGTVVEGFANAQWSGVTTTELVRLLEPHLFGRAPMTGLAHVVSEGVSKAELLRRLSSAFGLDLEVVDVPEPVIDRRLVSNRGDDALRAGPLDAQLTQLAALASGGT
jgi:dTDP-4-dehydrorhamnose reductase